MAENKTRKTSASVSAFLKGIKNPEKRKDCQTIAREMEKVTGEKPKMWGPSMVGFGEYHYVYESGREGDFFLTGFSPRAQNITLYIMPGFAKYESQLKQLGKHSTGKSCLYIKRLSDIELPVLRTMIADSVKMMKKRYG